MKNRIWIIIFTFVLVACAVVWYFISVTSAGSNIVGIYKDGELVERLDLNSVTISREITVTGEYGDNIILVANNSIKMKSAECPDKICVSHGKLVSNTSPIVCLPNKLVIKFEDNKDIADAKTGAVR